MPSVNSVDALKTRFSATLADRKVTLPEAEELIALVKDGGGVTNSERRQLREQFIANGDVFEADARDRLGKFISDEIPNILIDDNVVVDPNGRVDLDDPSVLSDDKDKLTFEWTRGALFVDGVSKDDVVQGMIGDCYMMAGFAAVAAQNPKAIEDAIKDNGDGTYSVRFFQTSSFGPAREVFVTVDGELPTRFGGMQYGKCRDRGELWVGLLEKAYAQWKGGYDAVGHGGSAGNVMAALTGRAPSYGYLSPSVDADATFAKIKAAIDSGKSAAAGTHGESDKAMYTGTGIYADHAYSILGTSEENGVKYVTLRNPWGEVEPSGNGADDGVFKLDLATFLKLYQSLYVS
jgi:hypothetical protein